jgi:alkanesulfonate monooxygenase SsuD/methylene tetrahydromethanopterin reductase-like flavin-dependent oxidoreductase (luciferase family)
VTIDDSFGIQTHRVGVPDDRVDEVRGRLDALLIAAFVAPLTSRIGLVPTVTTTHTEPFHVSKALATLDHTSLGRAGWQARVSGSSADAALVGRRAIAGYNPLLLAAADLPPELLDLFAEAADVIDVVRRLWDSWEDDAEIRDVATRRFIDRSKVHHVNFEGRFFSVRGPSITPRPPQGQPVASVSPTAASRTSWPRAPPTWCSSRRPRPAALRPCSPTWPQPSPTPGVAANRCTSTPTSWWRSMARARPGRPG